VLDVERWAELRREHFVRGVSINELVRRYGIGRNTVRRALRAEQPPRYERERRPSKLDPFKEEIHHLLRGDPKLTGVRIRELIEPLGWPTRAPTGGSEHVRSTAWRRSSR
jgi:transposase